MDLLFYFRENCHLCDAMRKALVAFDRDEQSISWREIDIDRNLELVRLYDSKVPVLCLGEQEVCHYFLDRQALRLALS